jgi:hypothetical protein
MGNQTKSLTAPYSLGRSNDRFFWSPSSVHQSYISSLSSYNVQLNLPLPHQYYIPNFECEFFNFSIANSVLIVWVFPFYIFCCYLFIWIMHALNNLLHWSSLLGLDQFIICHMCYEFINWDCYNIWEMEIKVMVKLILIYFYIFLDFLNF